MSFQCQRVLLIAVARRSLENDEQWDHEERRDHQQLVIVDVGYSLNSSSDMSAYWSIREFSLIGARHDPAPTSPDDRDESHIWPIRGLRPA